MSEEIIDVNSQRERELEDLRRRVDLAYENRPLVRFELTEEGQWYEHRDLRSSERAGENVLNEVRDVEGRANPFKGVWLDYKKRKCAVVVENPHMYIYLLRMAFVKEFMHNFSYQRVGYVSFEILKSFEVQETEKMFEYLGHESKHTAKVLGSKSRKLVWGIEFWEEEISGTVHYEPFVGCRGKMRYWEFLHMIRGPGDDMSLNDKALLGNKVLKR